MCLLGFLSTAGHLVGSKAVTGLGFISAASPLPLVFSSFRGVEGFAGVFELQIEGPGGAETVTLSPDHYRRLGGPYNLRNAYGAAIAGAPMLTGDDEQAMVDSVLRYALCPGGPIRAELGAGDDVAVAALIVTSKTAGSELRHVVPIECGS